MVILLQIGRYKWNYNILFVKTFIYRSGARIYLHTYLITLFSLYTPNIIT